MPQARPTRATLMRPMAPAQRSFRKSGTPRSWLDATVRASARTRMGTRPVQSFDQRKDDMGTGAVRTIQKAAPSAETAGKTKRTATAEVTKAAIARLTKAYAFLITRLM